MEKQYEEYLIKECLCTLEEIKKAYNNDRLIIEETYIEWLKATAEANGYIKA